MLSQVPWAHKYLAGWGYLLSADVALHIVGKYLHWKQHPEEAPGWYPGMLRCPPLHRWCFCSQSLCRQCYAERPAVGVQACTGKMCSLGC